MTITMNDGHILVNPTELQLLEFYSCTTGNVIKTIYDAFGNLYVWNGEMYEHREIMGRYGIPDELYETATRIYRDFGDLEELIDILNQWQKSVKGKQFHDGAWM